MTTGKQGGACGIDRCVWSKEKNKEVRKKEREREATRTRSRKNMPAPLSSSAVAVMIQRRELGPRRRIGITRGCIVRKEGGLRVAPRTRREISCGRMTKKRADWLRTGASRVGVRGLKRRARERKDRAVEEERRKARRLRESWKT